MDIWRLRDSRIAVRCDELSVPPAQWHCLVDPRRHPHRSGARSLQLRRGGGGQYRCRHSEDSNQNACSDIGRHHLGEAEVIERRTDEDGAWDRPGNATGLAVQITRHNGQQSWNRVGAKYPCRDLVVFKVSLRRDGKENGERAWDGEEPSNHAVGDRMTVQRRAQIYPARPRPRDGLDDRDVRIGGAIAAHTTSDSRSLFSSSVAPILRTVATGPAWASCMKLQPARRLVPCSRRPPAAIAFKTRRELCRYFVRSQGRSDAGAISCRW